MAASKLLPAALALAALATVPAAPAAADQAVAELGRQGPVAGYAGWEGWSRYDAASGRYALTLRAPDGTIKAAPLSTSSKPWDFSLGPDANGAVVAIYRKCGSSGCDVHRLYVTTGRDQTLSSVSSPSYNEATPAIWHSTVAFTRRINGCDVPYVNTLGSSAASRRLLKSKCLQTAAGQVSIMGTRIAISSVDASGADANGAGRKVSELRKYSATSSGSMVLLSAAFGEETNLFGQVGQDSNYAYTVRYGVHPTNTFVRVSWSGGKAQEIDTFRTITGGFAKPASNTSLYVEQQGGADAPCDGTTEVPCRLVFAPAVPFTGIQRTLTPQLTVAYQGQAQAGQPLTFSGQLTQQVVAADELVSTTPLPDVPVALLHRAGSSPETFDATGLTGVTAADGTYAIVLPAVGADPFYTAVASTPVVDTWAGRGTVGSVTP
jgi:hypothetical protein